MTARMFEVTVFKLHSDKFAKSQASHRQVLVDHLEASAERHGYEVSWTDQSDEPSHGSLWKDNREVGIWKIEEVKA